MARYIVPGTFAERRHGKNQSGMPPVPRPVRNAEQQAQLDAARNQRLQRAKAKTGLRVKPEAPRP